jgi:hypothetical protein
VLVLVCVVLWGATLMIVGAVTVATFVAGLLP